MRAGTVWIPEVYYNANKTLNTMGPQHLEKPQRQPINSWWSGGLISNTWLHRKAIELLLSPPSLQTKASGLKKKLLPSRVQWMPRLPKGNQVDDWNVKNHPLQALGAGKSRISHFHGGIRQLFRGYDVRAWNAHFRASLKKIKSQNGISSPDIVNRFSSGLG